MQAIVIENVGPDSRLVVQTLNKPSINTEQLLVKVHATALNRADLLQRMGKYPPPAGDSDLLGLEIAGEVVAIGTAVKNFALGDKVFGLVGGGGYAEYCVLDHLMAIPMPPQWDFTHAAAIPEAFFTANETLFELGELKRDETVLIHAGGSGVSTAGLQMAKHVGARVFITAGSTEKITKACALGADAGINYKTQDFVTEVLALTHQQGVDVIEDFIGGDYLEKHLSLLKPAGRLIQVATLNGRYANLDLATLMQRRIQIKGSVMRSRSLADKRLITERFVQRWLPVLLAGDIHPVIDRIFPFKDVEAAHQYMTRNENFGKIILSLDHTIGF